jgi:hypothetical protein
LDGWLRWIHWYADHLDPVTRPNGPKQLPKPGPVNSHYRSLFRLTLWVADVRAVIKKKTLRFFRAQLFRDIAEVHAHAAAG